MNDKIEWFKQYEEYLNSPHWRELRSEAINLQGRRCQLTGLSLNKKETHVHHWIYRERFEDTQLEDLSVLGEIPHQLIHSWIKSDKIDRNAPSRLEDCRNLYHQWLIHKRATNKFYKRLKAWLKDKGAIIPRVKKVKRRKKSKREKRIAKILREDCGLVWFAPPRRKWSTVSERDRHAAANNRINSLYDAAFSKLAGRK